MTEGEWPENGRGGGTVGEEKKEAHQFCHREKKVGLSRKKRKKSKGQYNLSPRVGNKNLGKRKGLVERSGELSFACRTGETT